MDPEQRKKLEETTRQGLVTLGASLEQIAWVLEPGIADEELVRRMKSTLDASLQAGLGAAGMRANEVAAVMDESGTPAEREARRHAAAAALASRRLAEPGVLDGMIGRMLEDPAVLAQLEARAIAEVKKRRRKRWSIAIGIIGALAMGGFVAWRVVRPTPCAKLLGTDAELSVAFGTAVHRTKGYDSKYSCTVDVQDASTAKRLAYVTIEGARWSSLDRDVNAKDFASVEPAGFGDDSMLGIAPPRKEVATDVPSLLARRRKGSHDPIGDALGEMGPAGHTLVARAGKQSLRIIFDGSPDQARAVTKWLAPRAEAVRSAGYR